MTGPGTTLRVLAAADPGVLERVELHGPARTRSLNEHGAASFPAWLAKWRGQPGVRVLVASDGSHAVAVRAEGAA